MLIVGRGLPYLQYCTRCCTALPFVGLVSVWLFHGATMLCSRTVDQHQLHLRFRVLREPRPRRESTEREGKGQGMRLLNEIDGMRCDGNWS